MYFLLLTLSNQVNILYLKCSLMLRISELKNLLTSRPFWLMDGAIGTELERRGYQTQLPFWTAFAAQDVPDLLKQIYQDYLDIGCDILTDVSIPPCGGNCQSPPFVNHLHSHTIHFGFYSIFG